MKKIDVPPLGDGIDKVMVSTWLFNEGQVVQEGEDMVELAADKAIFNVSAPQNGTLKKIIIDKGQEAAIGETLAIME